MGSFGDTIENSVLNKFFKRTAWADFTVCVALSTAAPSDDGSTIAEPTAASYARQIVCPTSWNAAASGALDNLDVIEFTTAATSWCTISHFALYDATAAGTFLGWGALTTPRDVTTGDAIRFAAGALDAALD